VNMERPRPLQAFDRPVTPRLAATVLCVRPRPKDRGGFEVCMIRRPRADAFAGGQYVFPGGKVDALDSDAVAARVAPVDPVATQIAAALPDLAQQAASIVRAAAREVYEEVGVLLGADRLPAALRRDAARRLFYRRLRAAGTRLDLRGLQYWVCWLTPESVPMRFDTCFFVAEVPASSVLRPDPQEVVECVWWHPAEAVENFRRGEIEMMFPTYRSLEQLCNLRSISDLRAFVRAFPKLRVAPRLQRDAQGGLSIEMPAAWPEPAVMPAATPTIS